MNKLSTVKSIAAAAILGTLSGGALAQTAPDVIRFGGFGQGFGQPFGTSLLAIAHVKGFVADEFKGEKTGATFQYFTGTGPAINEAIANDQLDFAQYGALPNIIGKAAGLRTRIIASYGISTVFGVARKDVRIASVQDLVGKKVAVSKGTILHWAYLKALQSANIPPRSVTLIDLKTADQLAALSSGSIDAAFGTSTHLALRDSGVVNLFYNSKDFGVQAAGFGAITVTEAFEKRFPDATQKVANALVRSATWLADEKNREEALQIWAKSGVSYASLKAEFEGVELAKAFNPRVDGFLKAQYAGAIEFSRDEKLIRNNVDLSQWLAPHYVEAAIARQGVGALWPDRDAAGAKLN